MWCNKLNSIEDMSIVPRRKNLLAFDTKTNKEQKKASLSDNMSY